MGCGVVACASGGAGSHARVCHVVSPVYGRRSSKTRPWGAVVNFEFADTSSFFTFTNSHTHNTCTTGKTSRNRTGWRPGRPRHATTIAILFHLSHNEAVSDPGVRPRTLRAKRTRNMSAHKTAKRNHWRQWRGPSARREGGKAGRREQQAGPSGRLSARPRVCDCARPGLWPLCRQRPLVVGGQPWRKPNDDDDE